MGKIIIEREWIETVFTEEVNRFATEKNAMSVEIRPHYEDTEKVKELSFLEGKVFFANFLILFHYTMHGLAGLNHGLLECRFSFDQHQDEPSYSLFELLTILESDDFRCYLPYSLYNEDLFREGFSWIARGIGEHWEQLLSMVTDETKKEALAANREMDLILFCGAKVGTIERDQEFYESYQALVSFCFTCTPYTHYLRGKTKKAAKKYAKKKKLLCYEQRLRDHLLLDRTEETAPLPPKLRDCIVEVGKYDTENIDYWKTVLISLALLPVCLPVALAMEFLFVHLISRSALAISQVDSFSFLAAYIMAFVWAGLIWTARYQRKRKQFKSRKMQIRDALYDANQLGFMRKLLWIVIVLSILGTTLTANCNVRFYENGYVDNRALFSFRGEFHSYDDVDYVRWYRTGERMPEGYEVDEPYLVLVQDDGEEMEMTYPPLFGDLTSHTNKLLAIFRSHGVNIVD